MYLLDIFKLCSFELYTTGSVFMSIEKAPFRLSGQMQTWYKNIKCHIFSNLSFRHHSLLGGGLSWASVSAPLSQKENSGEFSGLTLMVQWKQLNPHESSLQEVTSWKVTTIDDKPLEGWSCRRSTVLICQAEPSHKLQKGVALIDSDIWMFVLLFFPYVLFHCCWSLNLSKTLQPQGTKVLWAKC